MLMLYIIIYPYSSIFVQNQKEIIIIFFPLLSFIMKFRNDSNCIYTYWLSFSISINFTVMKVIVNDISQYVGAILVLIIITGYTFHKAIELFISQIGNC